MANILDLQEFARRESEMRMARNPFRQFALGFTGGLMNSLQQRDMENKLLQKEKEDEARRQKNVESQINQAIRLKELFEGTQDNSESSKVDRALYGRYSLNKHGVSKRSNYKASLGFSLSNGQLVPKFDIKEVSSQDRKADIEARKSEIEMNKSIERDNLIKSYLSGDIEHKTFAEEAPIYGISGNLLSEIISAKRTRTNDYIDNKIGNNIIKSSQEAMALRSGAPIMIAPSEDTFRSEGYEYDDFGNLRPKAPQRIKKTAAQEKRDVEIGELKGQAEGLIDLFGKAREEAASIPGVGELGIGGRIAGVAAGIRGKAGMSPAVNVYQDKRKAFATIVAKAAGEQRPTDQDIERFMETLPDIGKNDEENSMIIDQLVADLEAKGAGSVWADRVRGKSKGTMSGKTKSGLNFTYEVIE